jgi:hypothetical protein
VARCMENNITAMRIDFLVVHFALCSGTFLSLENPGGPGAPGCIRVFYPGATQSQHPGPARVPGCTSKASTRPGPGTRVHLKSQHPARPGYPGAVDRTPGFAPGPGRFLPLGAASQTARVPTRIMFMRPKKATILSLHM